MRPWIRRPGRWRWRARSPTPAPATSISSFARYRRHWMPSSTLGLSLDYATWSTRERAVRLVRQGAGKNAECTPRSGLTHSWEQDDEGCAAVRRAVDGDRSTVSLD